MGQFLGGGNLLNSHGGSIPEILVPGASILPLNPMILKFKTTLCVEINRDGGLFSQEPSKCLFFLLPEFSAFAERLLRGAPFHPLCL